MNISHFGKIKLLLYGNRHFSVASWSCMNPWMLFNSPQRSGFDSNSEGAVSVSARERGDCEFYVMINGVFKGLFSLSYLSPELNCSLFPALWALECWRIIWGVPLTGEGAFDYLFMRLPFYVYWWEKGRKSKRHCCFFPCLCSVLSLFCSPHNSKTTGNIMNCKCSGTLWQS